MNPVRNSKPGMNNTTTHHMHPKFISNGVKKLLALIIIIMSMAGVAHAAGCPAGQFADSATICWPTQAQATAASASYTSANELTPAQQAASNAATPAASSVYTGAPAQGGTSAQSGFTALAPIPGLTDQSATSVMNATTLANFFNNLYKYLIGLAAILAVIEIIWGGLEISTKDSVSKQSDGKERITQAIFGLVLVLSPVLVFSIINPNILNLSLNLPKLDTVSTPATQNTDTTTITQQNNVDVGAAIAQAQQQCRDKGGTPVTDSGSIAGGTFKVTCDMTATAPVGTTITQQQCLNLIPKGTPFLGVNCSSAAVISMQQAGGYTCSDLTGGGVCLHK